jgi:hypothetical protein
MVSIIQVPIQSENLLEGDDPILFVVEDESMMILIKVLFALN